MEQRDEYFGVCTSKKTKFFGPRCHATVYLDQMIDSWCLALGSYHDLRPVPALLEGQRNLAAIGDKAYISPALDSQVWEDGEHLILALRKVNQKEQWPTGIQCILGKNGCPGCHVSPGLHSELLPGGDSYTRRNCIPTVLKLADRVDY